MATAEQLERALRNADAAGDTQGARVLAAELAKMRTPSSPEGKGFAMRMLRGVRDPIDAGAQMLVRGANAIGLAPDSEVARVDQINREAEQDYQQNWRGGDTGFDGARLAGQVVGTLPLAAAMPAGGATLAGRTAMGAAQGAGLGMLTQPADTEKGDFWGQKLGQAKSGAIAGAIAAPVTAAVSRVIQPQTSADVKALMNEGITPTPGQILGGRGTTQCRTIQPSSDRPFPSSDRTETAEGRHRTRGDPIRQ